MEWSPFPYRVCHLIGDKSINPIITQVNVKVWLFYGWWKKYTRPEENISWRLLRENLPEEVIFHPKYQGWELLRHRECRGELGLEVGKSLVGLRNRKGPVWLRIEQKGLIHLRPSFPPLLEYTWSSEKTGTKFHKGKVCIMYRKLGCVEFSHGRAKTTKGWNAWRRTA